jgi:pyruvate dehydrogenase E1 component alpha subunit
MTFRRHDHTTGDVARRYRGVDEVKAGWTREPMLRLRSFLTAKKLWDETTEKAWLEECGKRVDVEINAYLECKVQPVEAMFDYLYADPPPDLLAQRAAAIALEKRNG